MTRLALVRHGQTDWNIERRIQGSSDIPLNDTGRTQAAATGAVLADERWDAVYSSPLGRAMETARIIARSLGADEPRPVAGLEERSYGEAEGMTGEAILARYPEGTPVPGRESRASVVVRALAALRRLGKAHPGGALVVVTHGAVISSLVRHATDQALPAPGELIPNGSVHDFVLDETGFRLDRFNLTPATYDLYTAAVS